MKATSYEHGVFCWVDLVAHDMEAAARWYSELFGWDAQRSPASEGRPPYVVFLARGQQVAGLGQMSDEMKAAGVPSMWNSYVNVDDAVATVERARSLGASVTVEPFPVPGVAKLAFLTDPQGAAFALWQAEGSIGAGLVNEPCSLSWNELAINDVRKARDFYSRLFGWSFSEQPMDGWTYTGIMVGARMNGGIMPILHEQPEGTPPAWLAYFAVEDVDKTTEAARASGATIFAEPFDTPGGRISVIRDPQGAFFTAITLPADAKTDC